MRETCTLVVTTTAVTTTSRGNPSSCATKRWTEDEADIASTSPLLYWRVEPGKLCTRIWRRKTPRHSGLVPIARGLPDRHLADDSGLAGHPPIQTLSLERRTFQFGYVQPAAVFRRVPELQFIEDALGFSRCKRRIQGCGTMGVQIIQHHADQRRTGKMHIDQVTYLVCEILLGTPFSHRDMPPGAAGMEEHEQSTRAGAALFIVYTRW